MTTKAETTSPSAAPIMTQSFAQKFKAYLDLGKPNLSGLVVITGITGFYVATPNIATAQFFHFVTGLFLTAIGACALNMVIERDIDRQMERTRNRPIPSGRVSGEAQPFFRGPLSLWLRSAGCLREPHDRNLGIYHLVTYAYAYTPMKRSGPISTWIGAVPCDSSSWDARPSEITSTPLTILLVFYFLATPSFSCPCGCIELTTNAWDIRCSLEREIA